MTTSRSRRWPAASRWRSNCWGWRSGHRGFPTSSSTSGRPRSCVRCSSATACSRRQLADVSSSKLRVLPLGGLGEIGKNMMVVEYEGRIVVVDTGLRFPTTDMLGIDLVLPDFSYLRERVEDIEAIVITHGHEDHLGALPWVLRELGQQPPVYGGRLTIAMARSKLDEHRLREAQLEDMLPGDELELGPFTIELVPMTHSIPDSCA